jgi:N-acetylneuraminic acid mutarotase
VWLTSPVARLGEHWRFLVAAVAALLVAGGLLALLTDTPAEIRLREQLGLEHPCLPETEDSPGWREEPSLPGPTDEGRAVALDGRIYIAGGTSRLLEYGRPSDVPGVREEVRAESLSTMLMFDPESGRYERVASMPERLNHHTMVVHDGNIYVVGGSGDLLFGADPRREMFAYEPEADRWAELPGMLTPRLAAGGGVIGDRLYVAGGMTENGRLSAALEAFDFRTREWERLASMPTPREHVAAAVLDGRLYVMGGRTLETDSLDVVERYDPATNAWERLAPLPQRAGSFEGVAVAGRVLAIAGDDDREGWVTGAIQSYDPATDRWSQLPEMRTKRHGHAAAVAVGRLYTFGGSPCARFAASDIVESFDLGMVR